MSSVPPESICERTLPEREDAGSAAAGVEERELMSLKMSDEIIALPSLAWLIADTGCTTGVLVVVHIIRLLALIL
jgi:hypothetical protein